MKKGIESFIFSGANVDFLSEIGNVSSDLSKRVSQETDVDVLGRWVHLAARVRNVSEFEKEM